MEIYQEVVREFRRIADNQLWNKVDDSFLIGIRVPSDPNIHWCSLLGKDEELYGISLYRGATGLYSYDYIVQKDGEQPDPEMATVQDTILVTLDEEEIFSEAHEEFINEVENSLYEEDMHIIPMRMRPGLPAFICNEQEMLTASEVMGALANFLLNSDQEDYVLEGHETILLPQNEANLSEWQSYKVNKADYLPDPAENIELPVQERFKKALSQYEIQATIWEVHVCYYPFAVSDGPEGAYYPQMLIVIDKQKSEVIHHTSYEHGEYSQDAMLAHLVSTCDEAGYIPCEIEVRRPDLELLVKDLFADSAVEVSRVGELAVVKDALANLIAQIMNEHFHEHDEDCCAHGTCSA